MTVARPRVPVTPNVSDVGELVEISEATGQTRRLRRHERTGCWTLMATIELHGEHTAIFEDFFHPDGHVVFVSESGVVLDLAKSLVPTRTDEKACYAGHAKESVLGAGHDLLREHLLAGSDDPDPVVIAGLLPPIRRASYRGGELPHTFVGSPNCLDVVPLHYDPSGARPRLNPLVVAPEIRGAIREERLFEGVVGGWLPAVRTVYPLSAGYPAEDGRAWEMIAFAVPRAPSPYQQPVWYRFVKFAGDQVVEARYFDTYLPYPLPGEPSPEGFYMGLSDLHEFWHARLGGGMQVDLPERWIGEFCRHSMALEMITRSGDHPNLKNSSDLGG